MPVTVPAGIYRLVRNNAPAFVYATDVVVVAGQVTDVRMGAITLVTVPGGVEGEFEIQDAAGTVTLSDFEEPNMPVTVPAGTYTLMRNNAPGFVYATNVTVTAGSSTPVTMGAIRLQTLPGAVEGEFEIQDATGTLTLSDFEEPNMPVTVPPGTYTLVQNNNPDFVYATDVMVTAGNVTTVTMGAIRYTGATDYEIFDAAGAQVLSDFESPNTNVTVPPGTYVLKENNTDNVLVSNVLAVAGQLTVVP